MVPATARGWFASKYASGSRFLRTGLAFLGKAAWAVSVSALLVGIPFALSWAEEQTMIAMEAEQQMRQAGGELLTAGGEDESTASQVGAALGGAGGAAKAAL
jgi:mitochondrial import receptor subunit TOM22